MTESNLIETINSAKLGINEIMCPPGYPDSPTRARYSWGYNWEAEASALCSGAVIEFLKENSTNASSFLDANTH